MGWGRGRWETEEVPFSWDLSTLLLPPLGPPPLPKGLEPALFHGGQAAYLDGLLGCGSPGSLISLRKVLNLARGLRLNSAPGSRWNFFPLLFLFSLPPQSPNQGGLVRLCRLGTAQEDIA